MDNTTFGGDAPTIPQWTGPPRAVVQVGAILYASLGASLFSALLAMLGKQWLNRYDSTDVRGSAIERSHNRQRKFNGVVAWYFDHVVESLPLMLQAGLLLLGCALSLFLWDINTTIALVVLAATSFGVAFYLSIIVAGTASASCPYQTPGSRILRAAASAISAVASTCGRAVGRSHTATVLRVNVEHYQPWRSRNQIRPFLTDVLYEAPRALAVDVFHLGRETGWLLVTFVRRACIRLFGTISATEPADERLIALDLHCISWILQTSLDKSIHLLTLEYLTTIVALADFSPTLVVDCFNVLINCVKVVESDVVITQGLEQLATVASTGLLRTFTHLSATDPTSGVLADIHQRYVRVFPSEAGFGSLPFSHTFGAIHSLFYRDQRYWWVQQRDSRPLDREYVMVIHALAELAQSKYRRRDGRKKVPRWILSLAMQSLSRGPPLPTSAAVGCLSIVAVDLGCNISVARTPTLDERYVRTLDAVISLTRK